MGTVIEDHYNYFKNVSGHHLKKKKKGFDESAFEKRFSQIMGLDYRLKF